VASLWTDILLTPGLVLHFRPQRIGIAPLGVAFDEGMVDVETLGPGGRATTSSKYFLEWNKKNGAWRVAKDMFHTHEPVPLPSSTSGVVKEKSGRLRARPE